MATVRQICGNGTIEEVLDDEGHRYSWVEGPAVERVLDAWAERVAEGYVIVVDVGRPSYLADPFDCPVSVDGVALAALRTPQGAWVAGLATDPGEWPGGAGAFAALVVEESTGLGGASHWLQRRREDAARALNAAADAVDSAGKAVGSAVGGALTSAGDAVAALPTPREALNGIAEGVGGFAGTVVGAFGVAGAKGTGAAISALWEELPVAGKGVVLLAAALAAFIGAKALGRALK